MKNSPLKILQYKEKFVITVQKFLPLQIIFMDF
jgi:hypothetical protein